MLLLLTFVNAIASATLMFTVFGLSGNYIDAFWHTWQSDPEIVVVLSLMLCSLVCAGFFMLIKRNNLARYALYVPYILFGIIIALGVVLTTLA